MTSPTVAFAYLAGWMLIALATLAWAARPPSGAAPAAQQETIPFGRYAATWIKKRETSATQKI